MSDKKMDFLLRVILDHRSPSTGMFVFHDIRKSWLRGKDVKWPLNRNEEIKIKKIMLEKGWVVRVAHGLFKLGSGFRIPVDVEIPEYTAPATRKKKRISLYDRIDFLRVKGMTTFTLKDLMPLASDTTRYQWSLRLMKEGKLIKIRKNKYRLPEPEIVESQPEPEIVEPEPQLVDDELETLISTLKERLAQEARNALKSALREMIEKI